MPWTDRGDSGGRAGTSPRSQRDLDLLRALARRINPQDAGAHNNLGVVYYNKGLYDEAVGHFERALEIDPRMQVAERNLQIAYFGTGYFDRLTADLRSRLERDPEDDDARDRLARACASAGRFGEAVDVLSQMLERRPDDPDLYQRMARVQMKRGNLDGALVALRYAEHLDDSSARTHFMIGEVLYQRGMSSEALEPLERAVELDETLADAHHLLAFVYGDLEDDRAKASAARAAELNPSFARSETGLSLDSYSTARYEELVGGREDGPGVAEGGELAHYNLGLAFRQKALYDEALREFRLATERGEDTYLVRQAEAEMRLLRGDSAEAVDLYTGLIELESASPKLWNELGVARHQAGSLEAAEEAYRRALEIDPHYALAWNNLGVVRHHRGFGNAEAAFRSAVEEARAPADVWRNYGLMLHREARHGESANAYERAIAADRSSASSHAGYGALLLEMGRPEDARNQLLRAVELDPDLAEARYQLAFVLSSLGDYTGALRETRLALEMSPYIPVPRFRLLIDLQFEEASILAPDLDVAERVSGADIVRSFEFRPEALDGVFEDTGPASSRVRTAASAPGDELLESGRIALERGMLEQAGADAQRAGMYGARRMEVLLLQGEVFLRRGFSGEAVERFNDALVEITREGEGDVDDALRRALHGAARALLDLGRMSEAVEASERLCELVPDDVEGMRTLGEALYRVRDHARAALVLEQARAAAPDDVHLLTQLGLVYSAAQDTGRAESVLRQAVDLDDLAVAARATLGDLLLAAGRDEEAEIQYTRALKLLPTHGQAAFGLADLEQSRGRLRRAIHVMVDLLSTDPYRLDALVRLGDLLVETDQHEQARFAYDRVLRLDPTHEAARAALAGMPASAEDN